MLYFNSTTVLQSMDAQWELQIDISKLALKACSSLHFVDYIETVPQMLSILAQIINRPSAFPSQTLSTQI